MLTAQSTVRRGTSNSELARNIRLRRKCGHSLRPGTLEILVCFADESKPLRCFGVVGLVRVPGTIERRISALHAAKGQQLKGSRIEHTIPARAHDTHDESARRPLCRRAQGSHVASGPLHAAWQHGSQAEVPAHGIGTRT